MGRGGRREEGGERGRNERREWGGEGGWVEFVFSFDYKRTDFIF